MAEQRDVMLSYGSLYQKRP